VISNKLLFLTSEALKFVLNYRIAITNRKAATKRYSTVVLNPFFTTPLKVNCREAKKTSFVYAQRSCRNVATYGFQFATDLLASSVLDRIDKKAVLPVGSEMTRSHTDMGAGTFFKVGGTRARQKIIESFCGLNWQL